MTPKEVQARAAEFRKMVGPQAQMFIHLTTYESYGKENKPLTMSLYPSGVGTSNDSARVTIQAYTFEEAFERLHGEWLIQADAVQLERLRQMAVFIMLETHTNGECTMSALRMKFSDVNNSLADQAAALATRIAGDGVFCVKRDEVSPNGDGSDEDERVWLLFDPEKGMYIATDIDEYYTAYRSKAQRYTAEESRDLIKRYPHYEQHKA